MDKEQLLSIETLMEQEMRSNGALYSSPWELADFAVECLDLPEDSAEELFDLAEFIFNNIAE